MEESAGLVFRLWGNEDCVLTFGRESFGKRPHGCLTWEDYINVGLK